MTFIAPDRTLVAVIKSSRDKRTESVWNQVPVHRLSLAVQRAGLRRPIMLHRAKDVADLRVPPGNRLEKLRGDRAGEFSIRVNDQWRVCFRWDGADATEVEISDYH